MTSIGPARWSAPELTRGERYSTAIDVYQLALIAYELATRRVPFDALDAAQAGVAAARGARPELPTSLADDWRALLQSAWHRSVNCTSIYIVLIE